MKKSSAIRFVSSANVIYTFHNTTDCVIRNQQWLGRRTSDQIWIHTGWGAHPTTPPYFIGHVKCRLSLCQRDWPLSPLFSFLVNMHEVRLSDIWREKRQIISIAPRLEEKQCNHGQNVGRIIFLAYTNVCSAAELT